MQLRLVSISHLGYVIELLLHNIESSDSFLPLLLDLIPRLLEALRVRGGSAQLWVVPQDGVGAMRSVYASAYHSEIIRRLTDLDWSARVFAGGNGGAPGEEPSRSSERDSRDSSPLALHLGRCFKDLPMSKDEFAMVTKSCVKALRGLPLEDVAAYSHVCLLLSIKGEKNRYLRALIQYFEDAEAESVEEEVRMSQLDGGEGLRLRSIQPLLQVEGTVFVHASLATTRDPSLLRQLEKVIRSDVYTVDVSPFRLSLALSCAKSASSILSHSFSQSLFDLCKQIVVETCAGNFGTPSAQRDQRYVDAQLLGEDYVPSHHDEDAVRMKKTLETVARRATSGGWDLCREALVQLSESLMDLNISSSKSSHHAHVSHDRLAAAQAGMHLAELLFCEDKDTRLPIFSMISNRFISSHESTLQYLDLLSCIVERSPHCTSCFDFY
jgi:hypothetical protein